jgi:hypothetical protein
MLCCCSHQLDLGKCSSLRWCLSLAHRAFFYILPSFVHLSLSERVSLLFLISFFLFPLILHVNKGVCLAMYLKFLESLSCSILAIFISI